MNNTPNYQKWFNGSSAVPTAEIETTTVVPGQVLAGNSGNKNQAPPTNGESYDIVEGVNIPWTTDEQGNIKPVTANLALLQ